MMEPRGCASMLSLGVVLVLLSVQPLRGQDRLPPIPPAKMSEAQKKTVAEFEAIRKTPPTGPFGVLLRVPELMDLAFKWRQHVQARSVLDQRLTELAILVTARHWTQQYEWNARDPVGRDYGRPNRARPSRAASRVVRIIFHPSARRVFSSAVLVTEMPHATRCRRQAFRMV